MNARISRDFVLDAAIHHEGKFLINSYVLELTMDVNTEDFIEQNIALDRVSYLFYQILDSCIFVDHRDLAAIDNYRKAEIKVCPVPEGPYDQIIGLVIMLKINAITENKLQVERVKITSKASDNVFFYISIHDDFSDFSGADQWWHDSGTSIGNVKTKLTKKEKVVELKREKINDWDTLGLSWKPNSLGNAKVVFIDPNNHTD